MPVNNGHYAKNTMSKYKVDVIRVNTKTEMKLGQQITNLHGQGCEIRVYMLDAHDTNNQSQLEALIPQVHLTRSSRSNKSFQ